MLVRDIMTEEFETVLRSETLDVVVERMLRDEVDHVVVRENDAPAGIITRRKVLVASYKTDRPLSDIPISGFSRGIETAVSPNTTVLVAVGKLQEAELDCLPVVASLDIEGVLTKDDIIGNASNITDEVLASKDQRDWVEADSG
jgi:CBS domain-containing protein